MWLRLDLDGVEMYLRIQGVRESTSLYDDAWCRVSLHLQSSWLDYHLNEQELLCSEEVKQLSRPSQTLCKPPMRCRIEASHRR